MGYNSRNESAMPIEDMARREVVTVEPDTSASEIAAVLEEERVGSAVVVSGDEPVGIVTDRDIALEVVAGGQDPDAVTAEDVMTGDLLTVEPDELIYDTLDAMQDAGVRRIPVVEDGELVGIVTFDDFLVLISSELEHMSDIVQAGAPEY